MWPALVASVRKLDPRVQLRNPVMFVVEVGAVLTTFAVIYQIVTGDPFGGGNETLLFTITVTVWLWLTVVFANFAEALAEGRGRAQADALRSMRTETVAHLAGRDHAPGVRAASRRRGRRRGRRGHPRRRHGHRGHRLGRRVGHHGRVGPGHPRVRRRPQRGHGRHARALRPHRGRDHPGAGPLLPGSHDRARRGRRAAQDPQRDRAEPPARGADAGLRHRRGHAASRSRTTRTPTSRSRRWSPCSSRSSRRRSARC